MGHGSCIMGHGSVFVWVTGSWVTLCDPLSALLIDIAFCKFNAECAIFATRGDWQELGDQNWRSIADALLFS